MSPTSHSPVPKMVQPEHTNSQDSTADSIRKRVCKACDRCRLKKSKCDGSNPCTRCKADNAICVFGERKKSHDKVYPKGYVEMLEQQQTQLVSGLQEMYSRLVAAHAWTGATLSETNGHPLTHDILAALDLLEAKHDGSGEHDMFEEDCKKLQSRLISNGAGFTHRRGSVSSDSEHSQGHARSVSHGTPRLSKPQIFKEERDFGVPTSPPPIYSPGPAARQRQSLQLPAQASPLQPDSPLASDPQFYTAQWAYPESQAEMLMRSKFAMQSPELDQSLGMDDMSNFTTWDQSGQFDYNMSTMASYPQQLNNAFGRIPAMQEGGGLLLPQDTMDVEFNQFISVTT